MKKQNVLKGEQGFTLIEIIAVLVILGILAAVAVPRYIDMAANASNKAIDAGIAELNSRENLTWANEKLSSAGYKDDTTTFGKVSTDLGTDYKWTSAATAAGGTLSLTNGSGSVELTRSVSTTDTPGKWTRKSSS